MTLNTEQFQPDVETQGMTVTARTQRQLVIRRFFRHKGALFGLVLFTFVFVLAFSSIGFGPIPGWWDKSWTGTGTLVERGRPTLSLLPEFLGAPASTSASTRSARTTWARTTSRSPCAARRSRSSWRWPSA